jgi:hypothetical protein
VVAHVFVKNVGRRACALVGRPWIPDPVWPTQSRSQTSRQAQRRGRHPAGSSYP